MAQEKTDYAIALVRGFPDQAIPFLVREAGDASLKQIVESLCCQHSISIHEILTKAKHALSIKSHIVPSTAPISPPNSLGSPNFWPTSPRPPTRSSLSGQSGFSSNHPPRSERIIACVAKNGVVEEYPLSMALSSISTLYSFISEEVVDDLGLRTTQLEQPVVLPCTRAPDNILRAATQCLLTWLRSTAEKTHRTHCLVVPHYSLEFEVELGEEDYGTYARRNNAPERSPVHNDYPGIHSPHPQRNFYTSYGHESDHRSAMPDSDSQTKRQSPANAAFSQAQGNGQGYTHPLVDEVLRRQTSRKGSSSPSQIPRPCGSPSKRTGSPISGQSQGRAQPTAGVATTSKLSQSTQSSTNITVEYLWGFDEETSASGLLDLTASWPDFLRLLEETCQCLLYKDLDRRLHDVCFMTEGDRPKKRILALHDDLAIQTQWQSTVTWIEKYKSSKSPQLQVAIVLTKRRVT